MSVFRIRSLIRKKFVATIFPLFIWSTVLVIIVVLIVRRQKKGNLQCGFFAIISTQLKFESKLCFWAPTSMRTTTNIYVWNRKGELPQNCGRKNCISFARQNYDCGNRHCTCYCCYFRLRIRCSTSLIERADLQSFWPIVRSICIDDACNLQEIIELNVLHFFDCHKLEAFKQNALNHCHELATVRYQTGWS